MANVLENIFGVEKPIIGMVHLLPLPGNYLYDDIGGIEAIVKGIIQDLVSGPVTGIVAKMNLFKEIKENAGEVPVLANTGVTSDTVEDILKEVDGAIIGTAFKVDGITWNPVSQERVKKLMQKVSLLRKNLKE